MKQRRCIDCEPEARRKAPHPGPRCASHNRAVKFARRRNSWAQHILNTYGLTEEDYLQVKAYQGGACGICGRANGARRKLSVDHCHRTGEVRALLCTPCNRMLGHLRDDPELFRKAAWILDNPPVREVLGARYVPKETK